MRETINEINKTRKLIKKGEEQWNELPLWLKIFIPFSILYYLSTRKGPISFVAKLMLFFLVFPFLFLIFFVYWLLYTYYAYIPWVVMIGLGVFFAWFFTVIHYRRQRAQFKEKCMEGLKEKYDIEDEEIEEVIEVTPKYVHVKRRKDQIWGKDHVEIEYKCGNCNHVSYYEDLRIGRNDREFWMKCPMCNAFNWFGFSKKTPDKDGSQIISDEDKINLL